MSEDNLAKTYCKNCGVVTDLPLDFCAKLNKVEKVASERQTEVLNLRKRCDEYCTAFALKEKGVKRIVGQYETKLRELELALQEKESVNVKDYEQITESRELQKQLDSSHDLASLLQEENDRYRAVVDAPRSSSDDEIMPASVVVYLGTTEEVDDYLNSHKIKLEQELRAQIEQDYTEKAESDGMVILSLRDELKKK